MKEQKIQVWYFSEHLIAPIWRLLRWTFSFHNQQVKIARTNFLFIYV